MKKNEIVSRRNFLKTTGAVTGAVVASLYIPARAMNANERLRMAVIGVGGRGNDHVNAFGSMPNIEMVAVVDPHRNNAQGTAKRWSEKFGYEIQVVEDARRIFEDDSINAVSVATCNHWHSLMAFWACQSGKHVYVEKPLSHTLQEGRMVAEAAKKAGVCVQHGTQRRSEDGWHRAAAAFQSGKYGKPVATYAFANRPRNPIGFKPISDPPEFVNWDLWLGPVAMEPFHGNLIPYNWHWFWNTGNGEIGNNGVHHFDTCRLAMGNPHVHPKNVLSFGTRFVRDPKNNFRDQAETPNVQVAVYDYNGLPCFFEASNLKSESWTPYETSFFHTTEGYITNGQFVANDGTTSKLEFEDFTRPNPGGPFGNFIECIRNNTPEKLNAPVEEGHYSASMCHLANVSYRLGKAATWDECCAAVGDNPILQKRCELLLKNMQDVLGPAGIADVKKDVPFTLGQSVTLDNTTETVPGCDLANAMIVCPGRDSYKYA